MSAMVCFTFCIPSPRLIPSNRAVTCAAPCRFSRRISVWPGVSHMLASDPIVAVFPVLLTSVVFRMDSIVARVSSGNRTRMV